MEPPERKERVCEGYPDMDAHLMDNLGLLDFYINSQLNQQNLLDRMLSIV